MLESKIQKKILDYLDERMFYGELVYARVNSGMLHLSGGGCAKGAPAGFPDIMILYKGKFIGVEVKQEKGKQSDVQVEMQKKIEDSGGIYIIARSLNDVIALVS